MRTLALITMLLALTGCAAQNGRPVCLLGVSVSVQIGGSRTHPIIETHNTLAERATQTHELPITHNVDAATELDAALK